MTDIKYRVRLLYDVPGWAYYRRCEALKKYAPDDFEVSTGPNYGAAFRLAKSSGQPIDLALQLCYDCTDRLRKHITNGKYNIVLVAGLNVAWESAAPYFRKQSDADHIIFNSKMAWHKAGEREGTSYISNGVDREVFYARENPNMRKPRVLSLGSKFHRKNKGFDDVLPEVAKLLEPHGIPCDFRCVDSHGRERMNLDEMAAWYNTGTIYVVASQREGTPNPALEAAASGCVLVATEVGNMPELINNGRNGRLVRRDATEIAAAVVDCQDHYRQRWAAMEEVICDWNWKVRGQEYFALFRQLIDARRAGNICKSPTGTRG